MSESDEMRLLDWLIAIPVLLLIGVAFSVCWAPYVFVRFLYRSTCPKCKIPLARRIQSEEFDRPNVKFNVDHYRQQCVCRWCSHRWDIDILRDVGY